jgi:hypothetical protein
MDSGLGQGLFPDVRELKVAEPCAGNEPSFDKSTKVEVKPDLFSTQSSKPVGRDSILALYHFVG